MSVCSEISTKSSLYYTIADFRSIENLRLVLNVSTVLVKSRV